MMIGVVVVLYNVAGKDSLTCRALRTIRDDDLQIVVYDNSTRDYQNRDYCRSLGWDYLGGEGNKGLSVAYNACISLLKENPRIRYVCLMDDDTEVKPEYFQLVKTLKPEEKEGVVVPLIKAEDKLISPLL